MNSSLSPSFFFSWASYTLIACCRCIITGKLTGDQGENISLKIPSKKLFATSSIPRLALKSIRSQWFTPAKDVLVASSCDFILQDYIGFSSRGLPPHTSSAAPPHHHRALWWGFTPCLAQGGDAHWDAGLVPGGWSQSSWLCFTNSLPKHVT